MDFMRVLKANPYHDEQGLFSSKDKAKSVSSWAKSKSKAPQFTEAESKAADKLELLGGDLEVSRVAGISVETSMNMTNAFELPTKGRQEREVKVSDLISTQDYVEASGVAKYLRNKGTTTDKLPLVVEAGGKLYVQDGHHRVTAVALGKGKTGKIKVQVLTFTGMNDDGEPVFKSDPTHSQNLPDRPTLNDVPLHRRTSAFSDV